jgi:hypothetical protein
MNEQNAPSKSTAIAVVGMHRSGTSCLAGSLEAAGVFLGEVSRSNPANQKGNRENRTIRLLHDELLEMAGGDWKRPPSRVHWHGPKQRQRDEIIAGFRRHPLWGFKDPRSLLLLDGWLDALPDLRLLGIWRHPLAVGQSLHRRNRMPLEEGMRLWFVYNTCLLHYQRLHGMPLISFDLPEDQFKSSLDRALATFQIIVPPGASFFEPGLRSHREDSGVTIPPYIDRLRAELQEVTL